MLWNENHTVFVIDSSVMNAHLYKSFAFSPFLFDINLMRLDRLNSIFLSLCRWRSEIRNREEREHKSPCQTWLNGIRGNRWINGYWYNQRRKISLEPKCKAHFDCYNAWMNRLYSPPLFSLDETLGNTTWDCILSLCNVAPNGLIDLVYTAITKCRFLHSKRMWLRTNERPAYFKSNNEGCFSTERTKQSEQHQFDPRTHAHTEIKKPG